MVMQSMHQTILFSKSTHDKLFITEYKEAKEQCNITKAKKEQAKHYIKESGSAYPINKKTKIVNL